MAADASKTVGRIADKQTQRKGAAGSVDASRPGSAPSRAAQSDAATVWDHDTDEVFATVISELRFS